MMFFPLRLIRRFLGILLFFVLSGCSNIQLTYNNADTLLYWWLDGYIDITAEQKKEIKDALQSLHTWHRTTQLSTLSDTAKKLQTQVLQDVSAEQLCGWTEQLQKQLIPPLTDYLEPKVIQLIKKIEPKQIAAIEKKYADLNQKWLKKWQPSSQTELLNNRVDAIEDNADQLYGSLTREQKKWLKATLVHSSFNAEIMNTERLRRQQDLISVLKLIQTRKLDSESIPALLRDLVERSSKSPNPSYQTYAKKYKSEQCQLFASLHNQTTPEQRQYAVEQLGRYTNDFIALERQSVR